MIDFLKNLIKSNIKSSHAIKRNKGFTLIELLLSIIMGSIILGALLTFMNSIVASERQDQAKVTTDQEIQSALDYIASDLQEAVYIYDATGIAAIRNQLPAPTATDRVPVLVFWKRHLFDKNSTVNLESDNSEVRAGCIVKIPPGSTNCSESDYFVYSLVAYYLIKDSSTTWSDAARIGRYEIRDGIKDPSNTTTYLTKKDAAFKAFNLNETGTLQEKMNLWEKDSGSYPNVTVLIDYLDRSTGTGVPSPAACSSSRVPANGTTANPTGIYSFYACIDSTKTLAHVYLRGNALARIEPISRAIYTDNKSAYFPTGSIQVKGRGFISGE